MALVGPSARNRSTSSSVVNSSSSNNNSIPAYSVEAAGMSSYLNAAPVSHMQQQHTILAAAHGQILGQAAGAGFYSANNMNGNGSVHHAQQQQQQQPQVQHQQQQAAQEVQPDRPIGYGAFGVVW